MFVESIPGKFRYNCVKSHYASNPNVIVIHVTDELPQYPHEDPENFWKIWHDVVYSRIEKLDCVFASEDYVKPFADALGISSFMVDRYRIKVPISGTEIRENPLKNWDFIPDVAKPYFTKRIAILGPESTGKSTLCSMLANNYKTDFVEEYGRLLYEFRNGDLNVKSFIDIADGRQILEDYKLKTAKNKLLFCDTEDITTLIFARKYHPNDCKVAESYIVNKMIKDRRYDMYLLLSPDCYAIQDGTRKFIDGDNRWKHFHEIQSYLERNFIKYHVISGDWNNRYITSMDLINKKFKLT